MPSRSHLRRLDGVTYLFTRRRGGWEGSTRCDCALGPHWHPITWAETVNDLIMALRFEAERAPA